MPDIPADLEQLRVAFAASPENLALLKILVGLETKYGFFAEAEALLRTCLQSEEGAWAQSCLALNFEKQNRIDEALVLIESLLATQMASASDLMLHARLLIRNGEIDLARHSYRAAVDQDPTVSDAGVEKRLNEEVTAAAEAPHSDHYDEQGREKVLRQAAPSDSGNHGEQLREKPKATFADVGGMEDLKKQVRMKIILPIEKPEMFEAYGKKIGGGILLYGPPGCGKTLFARATAGEINASFFSIGIHDVLDPYVGSSEQKLHQIFETARAHKPAVIFFDEIDALASNRRDFSSTTGRQVINQFLSELDGIDTTNDGLLILGATNAPWHLDPAFRRPGRFDRVLFVPPPDEVAREEILAMHLKGVPAKNLDLAKIARKTKRYSGADLRAIIDRAVEAKLEQALETGIPEPLTTKELVRGLKEQSPTTGEWFASARNHAIYANQGGVYDDVLSYLDIDKS